MNKKRKIVAIRRDVVYSLDAAQKDRDILQSVINRIGGDVRMIDEANLSPNDEADICFSMGRHTRTLQLLRQMQAQGTRVINQPEAVEMCSRKEIMNIMRLNHIPMPPERGADGYWLKRGDAMAHGIDDVVFCKNETELALNQAEWQHKHGEVALVSAHVPGDLIKFYAVGDHFFRWYRLQTHQAGYDFDVQQLVNESRRLAQIIGIEVYGGDCIVCVDGTISMIDFNDWPSFAPCREEAADAIAQLLEGV